MDQKICGISNILRQSTSWIEESSESLEIVLNILSTATMLPLVTESSFEVVSLLLESKTIRKEKYSELVDLLISYPTSAASLAASSSQRTSSGSPANSEARYFTLLNQKTSNFWRNKY